MESSYPAAARTLEPVFAFMSSSLAQLETTFYKIPGSHVAARYVKSSHQNDPGRTVVEVLIFVFLIFTILQQRTRAGDDERHFIKYSDEEIDESVDDWTPEPLGAPLDDVETADLAAVPVIVGPIGPKPRLLNSSKPVINMVSYNFTGLAGNELIRDRAIETLRKYGLGSCGPPGFYGTIDVHMELERNLADFLGTESVILYSQSFSTIPSVISAFAKRHDIIVADRGVNFAIQKGLQISRSTIRWFDHNDPRSLEDVLIAVEKERKKRRAPLTRRFIVTEGIFEKDGSMADLPRIIELKNKYKFRLILDESISFGTVGRTGRGLTELYNVPASEVDMLVGSVANGLNSAGGFCAGARAVTEHQRINGTSFVFSAAGPALLAVAASEGINILCNTPSLLSTLRGNIAAVRAILDRVDVLDIPSHPASPIIHLHVRTTPTPTTNGLLDPSSAATISTGKSNPLSVHPREPPTFDIAREERLLQELVDECLAQGVWITRAKRLRGQELVEARPSVRLAVSAALSRKDCERAAQVVRAAAGKVLGRRR
ncbi:serine palmitoyltransferase [Vararia minispora EC-137]|uniref:Serine palmitoyltransferase n=1 Tax=Vararia minispora EC-137 TaxID=1314806 RepID=A0ACB8QMG4_9AGAM|nr:serine palmitoyltransferase [Vararia minispora EC-137]